jgi:hypothetical protein
MGQDTEITVSAVELYSWWQPEPGLEEDMVTDPANPSAQDTSWAIARDRVVAGCGHAIGYLRQELQYICFTIRLTVVLTLEKLVDRAFEPDITQKEINYDQSGTGGISSGNGGTQKG